MMLASPGGSEREDSMEEDAAMTETRGDVWILRDVLERELSPSTTSAVLFEALTNYGAEVPETRDALRALARTAIEPALVKRVEAELVARLMGGLLDALEGSEPEIVITSTPMRDSAPMMPSARTERDETRAVPTVTTPVPVLVIAGGGTFERRLAVALGPRRVAPMTAATIADVRKYRTCAIVLVDATDFAPVEPVDLADELAGVPETTARVIWGADLPFGRRVLGALSQIGVNAVQLTQRDGIDPLLDLIKARRRAAD
jgi:hypothetical protein